MSTRQRLPKLRTNDWLEMAKASELAISDLRQAWAGLNALEKEIKQWTKDHDHKCPVCGYVLTVCDMRAGLRKDPLEAMRLIVRAVDAMRLARKGIGI